MKLVNWANACIDFVCVSALIFVAKPATPTQTVITTWDDLLRMETKRNFANIGRKTEIYGHNLQHFMSNSPWSAAKLIEADQGEIQSHPAFQKVILVLDESAEEKAGGESAGAGRQHNGRLEKIEMSQVVVFLSLVAPQVNTWIDGELYIPTRWFEDSYAEKRKTVGIPIQVLSRNVVNLS